MRGGTARLCGAHVRVRVLVVVALPCLVRHHGARTEERDAEHVRQRGEERGGRAGQAREGNARGYEDREQEEQGEVEHGSSPWQCRRGAGTYPSNVPCRTV